GGDGDSTGARLRRGKFHRALAQRRRRSLVHLGQRLVARRRRGVPQRVTAPSKRLRRYQTQTLALLVVGYSGYYLCRSNFSVTLPLILSEFAAAGIDPNDARVQMGTIASIGTFAYAIGKFL